MARRRDMDLAKEAVTAAAAHSKARDEAVRLAAAAATTETVRWLRAATMA